MNNDPKYMNGRDYWDAAVIASPAAYKLRPSTSIIAPFEAHQVDITLLVLCHNNQDTIASTLDTVMEAMDVVGKTFEIIIIDDHSEDRTVEMLRGYINEFAQVRITLLMNKKRKGVAANYVDGAFIGCGKYYRLVYGDNSEAVETMVDILGSLGEADIIVPYYISMIRKSLWQRFNTNGFTWCINMITGNQINFYEALHVHLRFNVMRWQASSAGSSYSSELLCRLLDFGFTYKQVPCRAVPNRARDGFSLRLKNKFSAAHTLLELFIRRVSNNLHDSGE